MMLIDNSGTADATDLGWVTGSSPLMQNNPVVSVDPTTGESSIEATLDGRVNSVALGVKVKVARDANGKWACTVKKSSNSGWKDEFAPKACVVIP
ncbi:MAG: pilin [Candidatus Thiothrix sulfatifontis]|nr:MAG: pilin [Candidatus Thiothrix sulfatifontis]